MSELSAATAANWLLSHGYPGAGIQFTELGGGISNKVVLAESPDFRAVLKQSLGQLRTELGWYSDRDRIFRESGVMRWLRQKSLSGGQVPGILFEDPETFTIAMEAAPAGSEMWKTRLFRGEFDSSAARSAGIMLGSMISASWNDPEADRLFGDQTIFTQLRIEPYYCHTAAHYPEAAQYIENLVERSLARRVSLVHGDWSPKNLLRHGSELWAIDWEVIHFGDPGFDAGFLLNHLLLKSIAMPQHKRALQNLAGEFIKGLTCSVPSGADWVVTSALEHLPALILARVFGKSPAEYLDAEMRRRAACLAMDLMNRPPVSVEEVFSR